MNPEPKTEKKPKPKIKIRDLKPKKDVQGSDEYFWFNFSSVKPKH